MLQRFRARLSALGAPAPGREGGRPVWADELLAAVQRQTRAMTKQSLAVQSALETLGQQLAGLHNAPPPPQEAPVDPAGFEDLFDALDALDQAIAHAGEPALVEGLQRVRARVQGFCERRGYARISPQGQPPDPRIVRVVATEACETVPAGRVTRVVRAAVLSGEQVVREGEVIVGAIGPDLEREAQ